MDIKEELAKIARENIGIFEDAGCGMYNLDIDIEELGYTGYYSQGIFQIYPYSDNEYYKSIFLLAYYDNDKGDCDDDCYDFDRDFDKKSQVNLYNRVVETINEKTGKQYKTIPKNSLAIYLAKETTFEDKIDIINAWEEDRGAEAEEFIYDLHCEEDRLMFVNLYGTQTTNRCKKEGRFWFGGEAYYANEEDKKPYRITKIWCVNKDNIDIILSDKNIFGEILDTFEDYLKNKDRYYNGIDGAISAISGIYYDLIDFKSFYENEYNRSKKYKWVAVSNDESYFVQSKGEFESKEDCYNDMRNSALEKMKWNTEYKEDFDTYSAKDYINYNVRFYKEKIVHTSYSGVYVYKIIPADVKVNFPYQKTFAKEVRFFMKNEGITY